MTDASLWPEFCNFILHFLPSRGEGTSADWDPAGWLSRIQCQRAFEGWRSSQGRSLPYLWSLIDSESLWSVLGLLPLIHWELQTQRGFLEGRPGEQVVQLYVPYPAVQSETLNPRWGPSDTGSCMYVCAKSLHLCLTLQLYGLQWVLYY